MEILIPLLIVLIIIGSLLGGKSFGGTIRKGCGFVIFLLILAVAIGLFWTNDDSVNFSASKNCQIYTKPNIESDTSGVLEIGKEFFVEDIDKFDYFYEITDENEKTVFVRKECLTRK
ncbi:MAG: hypothetical protein PSN34_02195 [Urechidicola sp.]|nr:hypothetical protein [Urechidicola sp.]